MKGLVLGLMLLPGAMALEFAHATGKCLCEDIQKPLAYTYHGHGPFGEVVSGIGSVMQPGGPSRCLYGGDWRVDNCVNKRQSWPYTYPMGNHAYQVHNTDMYPNDMHCGTTAKAIWDARMSLGDFSEGHPAWEMLKHPETGTVWATVKFTTVIDDIARNVKNLDGADRAALVGKERYKLCGYTRKFNADTCYCYARWPHVEGKDFRTLSVSACGRRGVETRFFFADQQS